MKIPKLIIAIGMVSALTGCKKSGTVTLETVTPQTTDLTETVTATGTVEAVTSVDVGTQVTGIIDKLYVDFNSTVEKGQLIAEIEKTILESDLRSAEASVESSKWTYEYTKANYERDRQLHEKQLISDYEFQTTEKDYEVAKANYEKAQADRVRAAKNLNYAEIYSPIDGIVVSREVEVGQTVVSNMNVANLYTIADLDHMQVVANVDEADIGQVQAGQRVAFYVDAYPDRVFDGQVTQVRLSPTTESNVVTYEVIVACENPDHKLIPGLTANVTIYVMEANGVLTLPMAAFTFEPETFENAPSLPESGAAIDKKTLADDERAVWVVDGNKLIDKVVKIGSSNGIITEIAEGLSKNDRVAIGYDEQASASAASESTGQSSPFAPQPPGSKKKK